MKSICGILLFVVYLCMSTGYELPENFEKCNAEDSECIVRRVNDVLRSYPQGFMDLHLDKIDPLNVNVRRFVGNPNSKKTLDFGIINLFIGGLSNLTVTKFDGFTKDPKDLKEFTGEGVVPLLTVQGKYKTSGRLRMVSAVGEDDLDVTVQNLQIKTQLTPIAQVRDGRSYVRFENPKIEMKIDRLQAVPKNFLNGNVEVADSNSKMINDNWEVLWNEVSPELSQDILGVLTKIMESFTNQFPYENLFL